MSENRLFLSGEENEKPESTCADVYVGGKVRVSEFMIFLALQLCGSK